MNFDLTDEQQLLRDTTRELLARSYDIERLNEVRDTDLGWSREVWKQLADVGILGLGQDPEESGQIEIATVMTEVGRRLAPEPVASAALIAGGLIAEVGSEQQKQLVDDIASGDVLAALAHTEPGMRSPWEDITTRAANEGEAWTVTGHKHPVMGGDIADVLIVSATVPDGNARLFVVEASAAQRQAYRTFDGQRGAEITLDATAAEPLNLGGDATQALARTLIRYQSALCAEAVGAMEEALRLTTEYLTSRKQFGVTLNTFQTLTQRAADMYVSLELARSMNSYAAMSIASGVYDPVIASRAKLQIGRSGRHIAQEAIQLHGGIGMTAEYPVGHYAARLTAIDNTLGTADDHLRNLITHMESYEAASV